MMVGADPTAAKTGVISQMESRQLKIGLV